MPHSLRDAPQTEPGHTAFAVNGIARVRDCQRRDGQQRGQRGGDPRGASTMSKRKLTPEKPWTTQVARSQQPRAMRNRCRCRSWCRCRTMRDRSMQGRTMRDRCRCRSLFPLGPWLGSQARSANGWKEGHQHNNRRWLEPPKIATECCVCSSTGVVGAERGWA